MEKTYITLTGLKYYEIAESLKVGMQLICIKDLDNKYDQDAIVVVTKGLYRVGYVANSPYTVAKGTKSASRIYDTLKQGVYVEVKFIIKDSVICEILDKDIEDGIFSNIEDIKARIFEDYYD
ncbi:hypothetical protein LJC13_04490 [Peptostreptococcaceae bacterium OttesenSCG-928-C18]|nr:hypothetical protein [Peptostreptococcaceae bacterium OttesenSCG-928-C18]